MYTLWGNINAKWAAEKVLYESSQVLIVEFRLLNSDPLFEHLVNYERHKFHYVHKANGLYNYIGKLKQSKIIGMNHGLVSFELVIMKKHSSTTFVCYTKNDLCAMRNWKELKEENKKYKIIHMKKL